MSGRQARSMARAQGRSRKQIVKLNAGVRLAVIWVVYRGAPGIVTFDPMKIRIVTTASGDWAIAAGPLTGEATTNVVFSQPGNYVLRGYVDDGVLTRPIDVMATVQDSARH